MARIMEEKEIIALYIINKYAKQIRDDIYVGKSMLKKRLFELYDFDNEKKFPERFELDISLDYLEDEICDKTNEELFQRKYLLDDELRRTLLDDSTIDSGQIMDAISNAGTYLSELLYCDNDDIYDTVVSNLNEVEKESLDYWILYYSELDNDIDKIIEHNDQMHDFLHNGFKKYYDKINYLYDLKALTIKNSGAEPIKYHKMKGYSNILGVYQIGNFKFHSVVDEKNIDIDVNACDELEAIASAIKIDEAKIISFEEAIKILCDYNDLSPEIYEKIISGDEYDRNIIYPDKPELYKESSRADYYEEYENYEYEDEDYEYEYEDYEYDYK